MLSQFRGFLQRSEYVVSSVYLLKASFLTHCENRKMERIFCNFLEIFRSYHKSSPSKITRFKMEVPIF